MKRAINTLYTLLMILILATITPACNNSVESSNNTEVEDETEDNTEDDNANNEENNGNEDDGNEGNEDDGNEDDGNEENEGNEDDGNEDDGNEDDGNTDIEAEGCIFRRVEEVTSGRAYLIAAEGYIATPILDANYDYLQVAQGDSDDDGVIILENCNNAFIIEAADGGYTIRQAKDERYLYQYNNYNSFNVNVAPTDGEVWSINANGDDTFTITNVAKSKFVQYRSGYTSFGSYSSAQGDGTLPMLYELEGDIVLGEDSEDEIPEGMPAGEWLELPAERTDGAYPNAVTVTVSVDDERNYTHFYDKATYTSMWVAYPLSAHHMGSYGRPDSWDWNPYISTSDQVNLCSRSYAGDYSRGHLIPNASRNGIREMQLQTFYVTNSVPQIQGGFNGGIWQKLEAALQSIGERETIYIVTGVAFNKVGESKSVNYTKAKDDTKDVPVPNYFYKVVLKVKTNSNGEVTDAETVGFWFENKYHDNSLYANYTVTTDQVEAWTGFNFFTKLPDTLEEAAEKNSSWSTFQQF